MEARIIGHYLLTLTTEQEDRLLMKAFRPIAGLMDSQARQCSCLCGTATNDVTRVGINYPDETRLYDRHHGYRAPGWRYEYLCDRFGAERINAAIRNRILANRARRVLAGPVESAVVGSAA